MNHIVRWGAAACIVAALSLSGCSCDSGPKVCTTDVECATGQTCQNKACMACPNTQMGCPCAADSTCGSGLACVEKVCKSASENCTAGAANSILAQCQTAHRSCMVLSTGGAMCGGCDTGFTDVSGTCMMTQTCAQLNCSTLHRKCDENPTGHCTDCETGFVADAGVEACRAPKTCADITCQGSEVCVLPMNAGDAFCKTGGCGAGAILGSDGVCHGCPPCDNPDAGEDGIFSTLTGENKCICQTKPGFFWREGLFPGVTPCDGDNDGWLRESAKAALESTNGAITTNARCTLRTVSTIVLENELGDVKSNPLATPMALYETDRNDDQELLDQAVSQSKLPVMGGGGRNPRAEELNSMTKLCVDALADYNENGLADVNEWHSNTNLTAVKMTFRPYVDWVYFAELHNGSFEPGGVYRIKERKRSGASGGNDDVPLVYDSAAGSFWHDCTRFRDAEYQTIVNAGTARNNLDFASMTSSGEIPDGGFRGMMHHSQFKCVKIVDQHMTGDPPHWLTQLEIDDANHGFKMNKCSTNVAPAYAPNISAPNPQSTDWTCQTVDHATLTNGQVGFAVVKYKAYAASSSYLRGCVNECTEFQRRCPGFSADSSLNRSSCAGDVNDFGKLYCGCGYNASGPNCEYGCPGDPTNPGVGTGNLFLDPNFGFSPSLTGYWMCASPVATAYVDATPNFSDVDSGYVLVGAIEAQKPTATTSCENADCDGGYIVR